MKFRNSYLLIISIVLIILSFILRLTYQNKNDLLDFDSVTSSNQESYLYFDYILVEDSNVYVVLKGNKEYVIRSNESMYELFHNTTFDGSFVRVNGISKDYDSDFKSQLVYIYNKKFDYSMDSQIKEEDVEKSFGRYYLEANEIVDDRTNNNLNKDIANILLEIGIVILFILIIKILKMQRDF